jgi:arabinogalactan oligomer/maltooligosaccharide transport system permease protein
MKTSTRTISYLLSVLLVFATAFGLRTYAADRLTVDFDEDDYLRAGQEFAHLIRTSDWRGFQETNYRAEHPQLAKIMFGLSILGLPEEPLIADLPITATPPKTLPSDLQDAARTMSAVWGSLTALLLALINPLGGFLLAIHSFTIKYTSQIMLDGFAALMSTATGVAYYFSKRKSGRAGTIVLITSAVFLGMSASSKYLHSAVGFAILIDWFLSAGKNNELKLFFRNALLWGLLSLAVFLLCNPFYWPDPIERIQVTLEAVRGTTTNANVAAANLPMWQQFVALSSSVPTYWNPHGFLLRVDTLISIFAIAGFAATWKKNRFIALWLLVDLFLLLVWRTKWAQYTLVATAPLSFVAAEGIKSSAANLLEWWRGRHKRRAEAVKPSRRETLGAIPWLVPGLIFFVGFTLFPLIFQFAISLTDFNSISIRDGLNGGVWREVWEGLTGQAAPVSPLEFPFRSKEVQYIGLRSYLPVMEWITFDGTLVFNIMWTVLSVALQAALGLGAALLLWSKRVRFRRGWQTIFILPWAIPETIGALMWMTIFAPVSGWLALAVQDLGRNIPFAFLNDWQGSPNTTFIILLIAGLWYGFPFMMLAATAGLKLVPPDVFDAAAIDGANAWQTLRHVTLPLLAPLIIPAIVIRGIFAFNQFYLLQILSFLHPHYYLTTLATLSYNIFNPSGFFGANGQFAFSAALNIVTMLILIVFVMYFNRLSKADEGVTYA